jgi:hypothetical protein
MNLLGVDLGGQSILAYIERLNLTIRNSLARFVRRTMNCSKILKRHSHALDFFQAWYNFIKPHKSLRLEANQGNKEMDAENTCMVEGLTDHIWTIRELLNFRIPVQWDSYTTQIVRGNKLILMNDYTPLIMKIGGIFWLAFSRKAQRRIHERQNGEQSRRRNGKRRRRGERVPLSRC